MIVTEKRMLSGIIRDRLSVQQTASHKLADAIV